MRALGLVLLLAGPVVPDGGFAHVGPTPPPHGYPAIRSYAISTTQIRCGRPVSGSVETSPNVRYVEVRVDYRSIPLRQEAPGRFSLSYTVPWWLPFWLRHSYTIEIIARSVDGVETARRVDVTVR
ncbi:MAG TPA: hypothetical protein VHT05_15215 [Candidatus Elarobacter sp.]|jgi:hypothetical protein|nr:hypothetical protein [Candidatus Elarobacter sp.]